MATTWVVVWSIADTSRIPSRQNAVRTTVSWDKPTCARNYWGDLWRWFSGNHIKLGPQYLQEGKEMKKYSKQSTSLVFNVQWELRTYFIDSTFGVTLRSAYHVLRQNISLRHPSIHIQRYIHWYVHREIIPSFLILIARSRSRVCECRRTNR